MVEQEVQTASVAAETELVQPDAAPNWMRLVYSIEYLIALLASVVMWTQIGGQAHMDLIAWYLKLPCVLCQAWCTIRLTAAFVEEPRIWNKRSRWWFTGLLASAVLMGAITLYYHLHEVTDEDNSDESATTSVSNCAAVKTAAFQV